MPKVVDHDARRREIIDVVWRLIATEGLEAVTTRRIAAEAGTANGALLYYFKNKEQVITAAFEYIFEATNTRADAAEPSRYGLDGLRILCLEIMPLDHERFLEAKIAITFWQQALSSPEKAELHNSTMKTWRDEMAVRLSEARKEGAIETDVDIPATVDELISMLMGLQILGVMSPNDTTAERQLHQLDAFFSRIVSHEPAAG